MTGAEAKAAFMAKYYAETNADAAGWEDDEIEVFLQEAALKIVYDLALTSNFDLISKLVRTGTKIVSSESTWRLPTRAEMQAVYSNLADKDFLNSVYYWTSTAGPLTDEFWLVNPITGAETTKEDNSGDTEAVRAVAMFTSTTEYQAGDVVEGINGGKGVILNGSLAGGVYTYIVILEANIAGVHDWSTAKTKAEEVTIDLNPIIPSGEISNMFIVDITSSLNDYLFYARSSSDLKKNHTGSVVTTKAPNEFIQAHEALYYYATGEHTPFFREPKAYLEELEDTVRLNIIVDGHTTALDAVYLTYVRKPTVDIEGTTFIDVNETLHQKIIELGVTIAVKSLISTQKSTQ